MVAKTLYDIKGSELISVKQYLIQIYCESLPLERSHSYIENIKELTLNLINSDFLFNVYISYY